MRLDNYLLRVFKDVPKSRIYRIIRSGEVRVNSGRAKPGTRLARADEIRLPPVRQRSRPGPERPPDVLIEKVESALVRAEDDVLLFNKPAGLAVHAGSGLRFGLIEVLRATRSSEFVDLVHRLDRQTSGCLLIARSRCALADLRAALGAGNACKRYLALVEGHWRHGEIEVEVPLSRDNERGGERMVEVDRGGRGRASLSWFAPLTYFPDATLMAVEIRTGRTHQIRVHSAYMGHPVAADSKYGSEENAGKWRAHGLRRMFLHAARIALDHGGQRRTFEVPLAHDLQTVLTQMERLK